MMYKKVQIEMLGKCVCVAMTASPGGRRKGGQVVRQPLASPWDFS